ncbi:bacteriohopanetetrol glucosamine biosynthesis glycosyltransferase HpnI [Stakelama sediminis]|uniref:Ceramide glucosyltransferase n=1 Tax=Stakelama sediminis TaxID=463200 RepID=A0A840Z1P4_9SPHN|nr:bacteriohopanetetrol glucosamine biosynthesis glycosyltransferase HpnI [Stakelama sediminis]MBB5719650.1 ceramide glucosyltransferase [Stakelama sediminis]
MALEIIAVCVSLAAIAGSILLLWGAMLIGRYRTAPHTAAPFDASAVTLLKPLYGAEPRLFENLATFIEQDWPAPVQMLCGVQRADDPAIAAVEALKARYPDADIELVVDPTVHGSNAKVSNLINLMRRARHDRIVLSDSDMAVPRSYLATLHHGLEQPGVGAVSCLYRGRGDAGFWSRLAALGTDLHFLPAAAIGIASGMGHPCMGSTIAMRREMLNALGGFEAFADILADDHAIGAAVRARGKRVAIPPMLLTHCFTEEAPGALLRHELRWNATIAGIDPGGAAGSIILHPLALALVSLICVPGWPGTVALLFALAARGIVAVRTARDTGDALARIALIPVRDTLSFALFLGGFVTRSVEWRGAALKITRGGRLAGK